MEQSRPAEAIRNGRENVGSHEAHYVPASLDRDPIFCGDDRGLDEVYIQLFGGVINLAFNQAVVQEANRPGSVTDSLKGRVETRTTALINEGMHPGVHSDAASEKGKELKKDPEAPVGCAYAELREAISRSIGENGEELVEEAAHLRPELFETPEDRAFGLRVTAAHGSLAERDTFMEPGRKLVLAATAKGAKAAVLEGKHIAKDGIINLESRSTLDGVAAKNDGLPAYNHDAWAAEEAAKRLDDPSDAKQRQIADTIDAIGTLHALGVEAIAVRH
jgi:hypothetical protein